MKQRDGPAAEGVGPRGNTENSPSCPHPPTNASSPHRHVFRPPTIAVGHFIVGAGVVPDDEVLAVLPEIQRRWPGLSFRDFWGACILAAALAPKQEGSA